MNKKEKLLYKNKELFWDVKDLSKLDDYAIQERFLKYWNWKNIQEIQDIYWLKKLKKDYVFIRNKKRCDLSKKTTNFFNLYFNV